MKNKNKKTSGFIVNRLKQITNASLFVGNLIPTSQKVYSLGKKEFSNWLDEARIKIKNPANTNAELGHYFYGIGKISDALFRFKLANFMHSDPEYLLYIGKSYYSLGKIKKSTAYLQDYYKTTPSSKEALYFLSLIDKEYKETPPTNLLIKESFNIFSSYFTKFYTENINYLGDIKICDAFCKELKDKSKHLNILDLGCGNGLIGERVKESLPDISITGIDFAKEMINYCQDLEYTPPSAINNDTKEIIQNQNIPQTSRKTYDILINDDFCHYVELKAPKYQYILSRGLINYTTSLNKFFTNCAKSLDEDGKLFFYSKEKISPEIEEEVTQDRYFPYYLTPIYHSPTAILDGIKKANMTIISSTPFEVEQGINATLYVVKK